MRRQDREGRGIFLTFRKFLAPVAVVAAVVVFFLSYNTYLVDHSLEDLKFALDQTARAQEIGETSRIGVLLDDLLISEISSFRIDSATMVNLEFAKNIVSKGGVKDQVKDIEFLLNKLVAKREKQRGGLLLAFDRMNADIKKLMHFLTKELPRGAFRPEIFKPTVPVDLSLLDSAKKYEDNWQLKEAISAYEEFINRYPSYPKLGLVKLRLAEAYFKSTDYRVAKNLYQKLIEEVPQSDEAKVANILLEKVESRLKKQSEKERLKLDISKFVKGGPIEPHYNELTLVDSYLEKLDKETKELVVYVMEGAKAVSKRPVTDVDLGILEKAKLLEGRWLLREAEVAYEEFISKYPAYKELASAKLLLGGVYLKSRQYEKALSYYEEIAQGYPGSNEAELAKRLIAKAKEIIAVSKKRQELIDSIKKFKTTADLAQAYYNLGMVDVYLFDLDRAVESFRKVMELAPGTELAKKGMFNIGWAYKFRAKYEESINEFSRFIEKYPKDKLSVDSEYNIADSYYKANRFEEAAARYEKIADRFKDTSIAVVSQFQAGYTYLYNLHDPMKAANAFKRLKEIYPETDVANYASISLVSTTERSYRDYGFILLREGRYKAAKEVFNKALIVNSEDAWAYCGLGTANVLLILVEEGIESAKEGVKRMPDEYTYAALAFAYEEKGEYEKAIEEYKHSVAKNPHYTVSRYNLGRIYVLVGWYDLAIPEFNALLKDLSDFAEGHNNLGVAYWYKGRSVEAESEFKTAISHKRNLSEAHYNLGLLYETYKRYDKAAACFKEALSITPDLEPAQRHLERVGDYTRE